MKPRSHEHDRITEPVENRWYQRSRVNWASINLACVLCCLCFVGGSKAAWSYQLNQVEGGHYVRWQQKTVKYRIHKDPGQDLPFDVSNAAIQSSFSTWQQALQGRLLLQFDGHSTALGAGYDERGEANNENLILWENKKWVYPTSAIAMTLVTYRMHSGQIVDADIVLNSVSYRWIVKSTSSSEPTYPLVNTVPISRQSLPSVDLANTVTHEVGHFLGLGHSENADATMYAHQMGEEIHKRHLHQDDQNAIEKLYVLSQSLGQIPSALPNLPPPPDGMGCSVFSVEGWRGEVSLWVYLLAFCILFVYQRRQG